MTEEEFLEARDLMLEAVKRAKLILGGFSGEEDTAKIDLLNDGQALVTTWDSSYDESSLNENNEYFPGHLLFCAEEEAIAWVKELKRKQEAESKAQRMAYEQRQKAQERAIYETLKAKYDGK